jgi:hypothetical protein
MFIGKLPELLGLDYAVSPIWRNLKQGAVGRVGKQEPRAVMVLETGWP